MIVDRKISISVITNQEGMIFQRTGSLIYPY